MNIVHRLVFSLFVALCSQSLAQTTPSLTLVSPSDGTIIQPGQNLTIEVTGSNLPSDGQEVVIGDVPIGMAASQAAGSDLTFQLTIPSYIQAGSYSLWAALTSSTGDVLSRSVVLKVMPNYQLNAIGFDKGVLTLAGPGRQSTLTAFGYLAGQKRLLDNQFLSFASVDPTTATIDENGVVTAVAAGKTTVSATYGTVSGSISVVVGRAVTGMPVAASPTISPSSGSFTAPITVTITDTTPGSVIYYTSDRSTPTSSSSTYSGAITVSTTETLQAIAIASGYTNSPVASATYTINIPPPQAAATPTFSPAAGTYASMQTVSISDTTAGASIYYTIDGTTPTSSSALYSAPLTVTSSQSIQAIAVAAGFGNSAIATAAYTINLPPQDFTFALSASSLAVTKGQSGTLIATVGAANGFNQPVAFACSELPAGATCSFSPSTVNGSGTATVTVTTSASAALLSDHRTLELAGLFTGLSLLFAARRYRRLGRIGLLAALAIVFVGAIGACGGGSGSSSKPPAPTTSTVTVTATSGSLAHTATFTLTVN